MRKVRRAERRAQRADLWAGVSSSSAPTAAEAIRILNDLLTLDRVGVSAAMLTRYPVNEAVADAPRVQVTPDCRLGWIGLLNALYPALPDGSGPIMAIVDGDSILRFELSDPVKHGKPPATLEAPSINLPPPESMHGYADQFPGTDDPTVKPGDW